MKLRVPTVFNDRDTVMHRRDPRAKVVGFLVLVALLYLAPTWEWMVALLVLGLGLAVVARVPPLWLGVLTLLLLPNVFFLLIMPIAPALLAGEATLSSIPGIESGLKLSLSWLAALFVSLSLVTTMRIEEMVEGFRGLGAPEVFCFAWQYTFLLLYLTINDIIRIVDAMKLKGLDLETRNPLTLAINLPKLFIPVIFTVVRRANTMMAVLQQRGYSFTERPAHAPESTLDVGDAAFVVGAAALVAVVSADRFGLLTVPWLA